jgi:glycine hydroxymethyltransferase
MLGASAILYPYSINEIIEYSDKYQYIVYDGSHVLGLIAGNKFQNPLNEDVPILFGSTHKSFPGPQGGLVLGTDKEVFDKLCSQFSIQESNHPFGHHHGTILVDNVPSNRITALGFSILEMLEYGSQYAEQIVKNTNALGDNLKRLGFPILKTNKHGFSKSHQLLLPMTAIEGLEFKNKLERVGIFTDAFVRFGTAEITRRGYTENDMKPIAEFIHAVFSEDHNIVKLKQEVNDFCSNFTELEYCFTDYKEIL